MLLDLVRQANCGEYVLEFISEGKGNYGKTPLHYALTQNRNDVVRLLIKEGASTLVVNNKGQTVRSMCPGHLDSYTTSIVIEAERNELINGGLWRNYRETNPDKDKQYGDLDPRFLDDTSDPDGVLRYSSKEFQRINGRLPEVVMGTSTESRKRVNMKVVEGGQKFRQPTISKKERARDLDRQAAEESRRQKEMLLTYPRVLPKHLKSSVIEVLDSIESEVMASFQACIDNHAVFGLDCEWKPARDKEAEYPVATLQLSCETSNFIVDLQSMCRPFLLQGAEMNETESQLSSALTRLFSTSIILGFGMEQDLVKCAASFAHIPAFRQFDRVLDLQLYSAKGRKNTTSLQKLVGLMLELQLNKEEQCCDWTQRPLTSSQCEYASIDAGILLRLYDALGECDDFASIRLTLVDTRPGWFVDGGGICTSCGLRVAKQQYRGGVAPASPEWNGEFAGGRPAPMPTPPKGWLGDAVVRREPERAPVAKEKKEKKQAAVRVKLEDVDLDFAALGIRAGELCGHSKMDALRALAGARVSVDEELEFETRGGCAVLRRGAALFINVGDMRNPKYRNELTSDFTVSFQHVKREPEGTIVMFARGSNGVVYLGRCAKQSGGNKNVVYELVEMALLGGNAEYDEMVQLQARSLSLQLIDKN
jgi:hypothetical protein